jgi:hypothetical protein
MVAFVSPVVAEIVAGADAAPWVVKAAVVTASELPTALTALTV